MSDINRTFGLSIRRRRETLGMSQEELADEANLHRTYISLIERGRRGASIDTIIKLAKALRTTASELMADLEQGSS